MSDSTEAGTGPDAGDKPAEGQQTPKHFTQDEVTAIAAREKEQGKRAAEQALANELGVSVAEAKEILKAHRAAEEGRKDEATKAREAAEREKQEAEAAKRAAADEVHAARLERAFLKAGLELDDDGKLARVRRMVTVEVGASYEDVLKDVETIKSDFPALFGAKEDDGKGKGRKAPSGDPKGKPPAQTAGEDKYSAGMERARAHRGQYAARVDKKKD